MQSNIAGIMNFIPAVYGLVVLLSLYARSKLYDFIELNYSCFVKSFLLNQYTFNLTSVTSISLRVFFSSEYRAGIVMQYQRFASI